MIGHGSHLTHDWIWRAIDTLAERQSLSPSGLARLAGLDATTFNRSKRFTPEGRPRWPSTESIAKILHATGTSLDEFANLELSDAHSAPLEDEPEPAFDRIPLLGEVREATVSSLRRSMQRQPMSQAQQPEPLVARSRFALVVADGSLEPVYSRGNRLIVSNAEAPRPGDRVVVKPISGQALPRLLLAATAEHLEFGSLHEASDRFAMRLSSVDWIGRIVWARQ